MPPSVRSAIATPENEVLVSAASAWEIATKARLGKLPGAERFSMAIIEYLGEQAFTALDISVEHARRAGALAGPHRDPFDRMLIAQAQAEGLVLASNELIFDQYGVTRLW